MPILGRETPLQGAPDLLKINALALESRLGTNT